MDRSAAHFIDSDKSTGTPGSWTSNNYKYPEPDIAKIGISTMAELALIGNDAEFPLSGDYQLLNDLDAIGVTFWPIGFDSSLPNNTPANFIGSFDGRFFTISNLAYNIEKNFNLDNTDFFSPSSWNSFGLFFVVAGSVSNLTISNMSIECAWTGLPFEKNLSASGLLAASVTGTVTNVHVQGSITITASGLGAGTGISQFGGFCNAGSGSFVHCSSDLVFTATHNGALARVGGYCGTGNNMTFTDCYAVGSITHNGSGTMASVGGFCGTVVPITPVTWTNIYSAMVISESGTPGSTIGGIIGFWNQFFGADKLTFADCFWDGGIDVLDLDDIGGTVGDVDNITEETTANMYKQATYDEGDSDWDFTAVSGVWEIIEDTSYPTFQWQDLNPNKVKTGEQNRTNTYPEDWAHLNGETVQILEDGTVSPTQVVANGSVTTTGTTNHIGLRYKSKLKPMKI